MLPLWIHFICWLWYIIAKEETLWKNGEKNTKETKSGLSRIRTCEAVANRFQVCPVNSGTSPSLNSILLSTYIHLSCTTYFTSSYCLFVYLLPNLYLHIDPPIRRISTCFNLEYIFNLIHLLERVQCTHHVMICLCIILLCETSIS